MASPTLLLLALTGAISMKASPATLVAGTSNAARIELLVLAKDGAPVPNAQVSLSTNVGSVTAVEAVGGGRYRATLLPPKARYPQVAILLAEVTTPAGRERKWLTVPLHGADTLKLASKPRAKVEVTIAGKVFGPVTTDRQGSAELPVTVPPGVDTASVLSVDRLGNRKVTPLALEPPPFPRVRLAFDRPAASWADPEPLAIEVFAIERSGNPALTAHVELSADRGTVEPVRPGPGGALVASYRAPERVGEGHAVIRARLEGAGVFADEQKLELVAGPPASISVAAEADELIAGERTETALRVQLVDAKGNPVEAAPIEFAADFGEVKRVGSGWSLHVPDAFSGRAEAVLRASAGQAVAQVEIALRAGAPATGTLAFDRKLVRAGDEAIATVVLLDGFGNPVRDAKLSSKAEIGKVNTIREVAPGRYELRYAADPSEPAGESVLEVVAERGTARLRSQIGVLPYQREWGFSIGVLATAQSNFARATGAGGALELAFRPLRMPVEVFARAGYHQYRGFDVDDALVVRPFSNLSALAGVRYTVPLGSSLGLFVAGAVGAQQTTSRLQLELAEGKPTLEPASSLGWAVAAAGGLSYRVGPGRVMLEARGQYLPVSGQLRGNLGGLGVGLGYLFEVH